MKASCRNLGARELTIEFAQRMFEIDRYSNFDSLENSF